MEMRTLAVGVLAGALLGWLTAPTATAAPTVQLAPASAAVHFDVYLPLRHADELDQLLATLHDSSAPNFRHWLTPAEFQSRFGPSASDLASAAAALKARGFEITRSNARGLHVTGTAGAIHAAFGTTLATTTTSQGSARLRAEGGLHLPPELAALNARVVAFAPVAMHHPHSRSLGPVAVPANRYGNAGGYWFDDLKQAYDFPSFKTLSGKGRTIAIVMASDFLDSDLALYFGHEHLAPPKVTRIPVCVDFGPGDEPCGAPFVALTSASDEVSLDLQQAGGMAPHAHIKLFNIPDLSDQSILQAYGQIVDDNAADIVSSSFGLFEAAYFASYNGGEDFTDILQLYEDIFRQGNAQGITFVASSGDQGGLPAPSVNYFFPDGKPVSWVPGVEHPAGSPHVTAVGGTNLITTTPPNPQTTPPSLDSAYVGEHAFGDPDVPFDPYGLGVNIPGGWWGSGGGTSQFFAKPAYQFAVDTGAGMRTVPDISLEMGGCPLGLAESPCPLDGLPRSFTLTAIGGAFYGLIGTSVSAPGFAGVLALEEENLGGVRLGNVNYQIYLQAALSGAGDDAVFRHHISGFNGFDAAYGTGKYNQVVGVGTPHVRRFIFAPFVPPAGVPQTPSNP